MAIRTQTPGQQQQQTQMVPQIQQAAADPEVVDIALYCEPTEENISSDDDANRSDGDWVSNIEEECPFHGNLRPQQTERQCAGAIDYDTDDSWMYQNCLEEFFDVLDQTCTNQT